MQEDYSTSALYFCRCTVASVRLSCVLSSVSCFCNILGTSLPEIKCWKNIFLIFVLFLAFSKPTLKYDNHSFVGLTMETNTIEIICSHFSHTHPPTHTHTPPPPHTHTHTHTHNTHTHTNTHTQAHSLQRLPNILYVEMIVAYKYSPLISGGHQGSNSIQ